MGMFYNYTSHLKSLHSSLVKQLKVRFFFLIHHSRTHTHTHSFSQNVGKGHSTMRLTVVWKYSQYIAKILISFV